MTTSGGYATPANPCPANVFTRAALIALRTAASLRPECHYLVTGPVIGTAGNTSPTTIEVHAVSPTELALEARVHTVFAASAWSGLFDIDAGAAGTIFNLKDDWNNFAEDEDPGAPTVHQQVPWHRGSALFSGNRFDTVTLPGWDTAGGVLNDNTLEGSSVDLTGVTSGSFRRNVISDGSTVVISSPAVTVAQNTMAGAAVSCAGSGVLSVRNNVFTSGSLTVDGASTAAVTFDYNVVGGTSGGYRTNVSGKTGGTVTVSGNRLYGRSLNPTQELLCAGTASAVAVSGNTVDTAILLLNGSGTASVQDSRLTGGLIDKVSGSTGSLNIQQTQYSAANMTVGAANAATNSLTRCSVRGGSLTLNGPLAGGSNDFADAVMDFLTVTVAATATGGVWLDGGRFDKGTVSQTRTAGTGSLKLIDCSTLGSDCQVSDTGTVDTGQHTELQRVALVGSLVNIGSLAAGRSLAPVLAYVDALHSTINLTGLPTDFIGDGRMLLSTLTNAGFYVKTWSMEGASKTLTANQSGRKADPSFDNFV